MRAGHAAQEASGLRSPCWPIRGSGAILCWGGLLLVRSGCSERRRLAAAADLGGQLLGHRIDGVHAVHLRQETRCWAR